MAEPTSIRASVHIPGKTRGKLQKQLTLGTVKNWIRLQGLDEYTTNGLIELAEGYPTQALPSFRRNFNLMIERVREKRRSEQEGTPPAAAPLGEEFVVETTLPEEAYEEEQADD